MRMEHVELPRDPGEFLPNVDQNEKGHRVNSTLVHNLAVVVLSVCTTLLRWLADLFQNV